MCPPPHTHTHTHTHIHTRNPPKIFCMHIMTQLSDRIFPSNHEDDQKVENNTSKLYNIGSLARDFHIGFDPDYEFN